MYPGPCQASGEAPERGHGKAERGGGAAGKLLWSQFGFVFMVHSGDLCLFLLQHQCSPVSRNWENPANQQPGCVHMYTELGGGVFKKPLVQPDKCGQFTPASAEEQRKLLLNHI